VAVTAEAAFELGAAGSVETPPGTLFIRCCRWPFSSDGLVGWALADCLVSSSRASRFVAFFGDFLVSVFPVCISPFKNNAPRIVDRSSSDQAHDCDFSVTYVNTYNVRNPYYSFMGFSYLKYSFLAFVGDERSRGMFFKRDQQSSVHQFATTPNLGALLVQVDQLIVR